MTDTAVNFYFYDSYDDWAKNIAGMGMRYNIFAPDDLLDLIAFFEERFEWKSKLSLSEQSNLFKKENI